MSLETRRAKKREYQKAYYRRNKDYYRNYQLVNKARHTSAIKKYNTNVRIKTLQLLGQPICIKCGYSDIRALQVDHINGGGTLENKSLSSRQALYRLVKASPQNYQILCANCNWIKRYENNEVKKVNLTT